MPDPFTFQHIRGFEAGQRDSFEELVCQIARRDPPADAVEFRRVEGAGGDGGVEAYWLRRGGAKTGYQAKFHLKSADVDWRKIDNSVKAALANHPELDRYVVAIPCKLTGCTGNNQKSSTGWELWNSHKSTWEGWATAKGRHVSFEAWTLDELSGFLNDPANAGLVRHWFDLPRFDRTWFERHVRSAIADLDERYHPEDHVEVELEMVFDGLTRHPRLRDDLERAVLAFRKKHDTFARSVLASGKAPPDEVLQRFSNHVRAVEDIIAAAIATPPFTPWPLEEWRNRIHQADQTHDELERWVWGQTNDKDRPNDAIKGMRDALSDVGSQLGQLRSIVVSPRVQADASRLLLVTGTAGSGKSHLLAAVAESALKEGTPVLLLLGQHFKQADPWSQIKERLDLAKYSRDELLGALDAAAEAAKTRTLILIDALNEGAGLKVWRDHLPGFLAGIERYPNLAVAISCRSEYREHLIPRRVLDRAVQVTCHGFTTPEEQEHAARQYMEKRGIVRPATPWLAPEFVNPLFLRSCCLSLERDHQTEFPRGLQGSKDVLAFYLDSVGRHLDPRYAGTSHLVHPTKRAMIALASAMAAQRRDYVLMADAADIVSEAFQTVAQPEDRTWLEILRGAGLLRRDPDPDADPQDALSAGDEVIRFAFQRFSDGSIRVK